MQTKPLSLTEKKWIFPEGVETYDCIEKIAKGRNIDIEKTASWNDLEDPKTLGDIEKACERIRQAIDTRETVGIIGDYDADGITGAAQLIRFFRRHGLEPIVILPHRIEHGYGIHSSFINDLYSKGASLIITVDNGINAVDEIKRAKEMGMDTIITDHHSTHSKSYELLENTIVVHPFAKTKHSNKNLCGSAVAFTLIRALENDDWEEKDIDVSLAAIGTVADVMKLEGENRTIVQLGLAAMQNGSGDGVFDLAKSVKKDTETLASSHIGFRIAPRINASGRISDPLLSLNAILEGGDFIAQIEIINTQRQQMVLSAMKEVGDLVDTSHCIITLQSPSFHQGIIGLIAGRLSEKHSVPTLVGTLKSDKIICSLRSIPQYNIVEALERCSEYLVNFGGHAEAAGCTVEKSKWIKFTDLLKKDADERLDKSSLVPSIKIDAEVSTEDLSLNFVKDLQKLEPFGNGNPEPRFLIKNQIISGIRCVGQEDEHLQCFVGGIKAIGFGLGHLSNKLPEQGDVACRLGINKWNDQEVVQIFLEDIGCC